MANNDEFPLSAIDGATPEYTRRREGPPAVHPMADLGTPTGGQSGDARDKRGRSHGHSRSPNGHRRRDSPARRLESKLRDQDAVLRRMAAEMEDLKRHVKGKGVAGVGDHSERTPSRRSGDQRQRRTQSISITRSYQVGDSDMRAEKSSAQDSTYKPSRPATTSRYSYSAQAEDLRAVV